MGDAGGGGGASLDVRAPAFVMPRDADAPAAPAGRGEGRGARGRGRGRGRGRAVPLPRGAAQEAAAPPAADAPPVVAAPQRGRGRGRGRGARGESAGRSQPPPAEAAPEPASGRGRGAGRGAAKPRWWRKLEEDDPITLEPLASLAYPPFELAPDGGARRYYFDGQALASYLHASKCFQNPLNREALSRTDCERLDAYLRQHKLGRFTITRDFDDAAAAAAAAAVAGTAEALAAERAAAADALLRAFFAGSARRGDAGRRGGPQPTPAMQGDGNFVVIDDDAGMLRGRSRGAAEAALAQRPEAAAAARAAAEAFPSLPGVAPPRPAWPTLSASAAPAANAAPRSAAAPAAPAAERPLPSWWAMAAPAPARPAAAPAATSRAAADEAGDARRKQLAAAFGVLDPAARPSMFAAASAAAFSPDVLALARSDRAFVLDVEKRLDAALAARARRTSMPACGRPRRKLIHEVAERYGLVSSSYGEGPGRHVDVFCLPTSGHPTARLSDAALAPPEAVAAAAQPAGALPASKADLLAAQLRFSSVAEGADLERLLADSGAVLTWQSASEATAQFPTAAAMQEARDRLGGGLRGLFTVSAPPAEPAPPPRRAAAQHDPWADEPPPQRAPPKRPAAPADWQSHVQTESGVAAPMKSHIATRNAWAALGDEDEDAEDEDGDWDAEQGEDEAEDEADEPSSQHAASDGDNGDPDAAVPQPDAPQADSSE